MEVAIADSVTEYLDVVRELLIRGGPDSSDYEYLKNVPKEMSTIPLDMELKVYDLLQPLLTVDSMIGFAFRKPHGYAGDYEIIDRIYTQRKSQNKDLLKWDLFYHELEAPKAVRNRKKYFKDLVSLTEKNNKDALILNLGSGPCSDLYEYLRSSPRSEIKFDCLDMDESAIEFGKVVCDNYIDRITFKNKNAFRYKPDYQYDLIWSAGLFDYFSDKLFIRLLNRMYALVKDGGELVIGNFSTDNPSRGVMEVFTQWYLHHRNKKDLIDLALKAGVAKSLISVSQEEVGVNLFLHLKKAK